jgi:hypothetical protein
MIVTLIFLVPLTSIADYVVAAILIGLVGALTQSALPADLR